MGRWAQFPTHSGQRGATPNATAPAPATTAPLSTRTQSETARAQTQSSAQAPETTSISTAARCPVRRRRRRRRMSKLARRRRRRPVRRRLSKSAPLIRRISACLRTVLPANPTAGTLAGAAPRCPSRPQRVFFFMALTGVRSARTIFWRAEADTARAAATAVTYTSSASSTGVPRSLVCLPRGLCGSEGGERRVGGRTLNWFSMQLYNWSPRHHLLSHSTRIEAVLCLLVVVSCALLVGC